MENSFDPKRIILTSEGFLVYEDNLIQSEVECMDSIVFNANNIKNSDLTSTMISNARILSLRTLINVFEEYTKKREELYVEGWKADRAIRGKLIKG
jgi:hypothetical protein